MKKITKIRCLRMVLMSIPFLLLFAFSLSAQDFHTIDFDSTSTFFKNETAYSRSVKNTVIQVVSDIEQLIIPKYDIRLE